ncbi:MAG: VIT1/CCC1 transporter family protein [Candidatus Levybacteria bacterium]|nr:VIT1/CCC1 transporter family protein [Candidatus Levybacteria bacterium]
MDILEQALKQKEKYLLENKQYKRFEQLAHRRLVGKYVGDFVYGANDGIITTFAVVAGATGASLPSSVILILGFANLLADGISMGASNYLGGKSEQEFAKAQRQKEEWEIDNLRQLEVQEVRDIYKKKGFTGRDLEHAVAIVTSNKEVWLDTMMKDELGIMEVAGDDARKHGLATFAAFVIAGIFPLLPYMLPGLPDSFFASAVIGAATLFAVGALRTLVTTVGIVRGGMEMLLVGSCAAAVAYIVGAIIQNIVGVSI